MYSFVSGNYLQKVKPIALSNERRQNPHAETTAQEKHQLRGLNGSMNWPVTQLMLYGAASLSIQAANVEKSILEDVHEANKTLRFLKAFAAVGLTYVRLGDLGNAPRRSLSGRISAICCDSQCSRIWSPCAFGCYSLGIKEGESHFSRITGR